MLLAEAPLTIWDELQIFGLICGAPAIVVAIVILLNGPKADAHDMQEWVTGQSRGRNASTGSA